MKKRWITLTLTAAVMAGLCGCAGNSGTSGAGDTAGAKTEAETTTAKAETVAQTAKEEQKDEITLQFWEMNYGSDDAYLETCEKLIAQYESENPGVNIEVTVQPWDNYYQLFLTAVSSNAAPDVASVALDLPDMYARMGEALELNDVVAEWKQDGTIDDYGEATMKSFTYDGDQIAVPYMVGYRGIFYRSDYLKECGIEKVPETWDELLAACEKIKEVRPDLTPLDFAGADMGLWHYFMCFAMSNDAGIVKEDGTPGSTDDRYKAAIDLFKTFKEKGYVADGVLGHKSADAEKLYYSGKSVFWFTSFPASIFDYPEILENTEVFSAFKGPDGTAVRTSSFSDALMAFSQTKHPEEAKKFVKWWAENCSALYTEGGCWAYPAKKSFFTGETFNNKVAQGVLNKIVPTAVPCTWPIENIFPGFSQVNGEQTMNYSAQEALNGKVDTDEIARIQAEKIQEAIDIATEE